MVKAVDKWATRRRWRLLTSHERRVLSTLVPCRIGRIFVSHGILRRRLAVRLRDARKGAPVRRGEGAKDLDLVAQLVAKVEDVCVGIGWCLLIAVVGTSLRLSMRCRRGRDGDKATPHRRGHARVVGPL